MSNYGHVRSVTATVGGKTCHFRSKLEYRYAVYLELLKQQGHIEEWEYEPQHMKIEFEHGRIGNKRTYLPDFTVLYPGEEVWEIHETKGRFQPLDYKKLLKYSEMHGNPIVLIFASLTDCKSARAQYNRAKRLEKHIKRVIYDANKSLFKPISHLFDY
jgi:hypothetical protein